MYLVPSQEGMEFKTIQDLGEHKIDTNWAAMFTVPRRAMRPSIPACLRCKILGFPDVCATLPRQVISRTYVSDQAQQRENGQIVLWLFNVRNIYPRVSKAPAPLCALIPECARFPEHQTAGAVQCYPRIVYGPLLQSTWCFIGHYLGEHALLSMTIMITLIYTTRR